MKRFFKSLSIIFISVITICGVRALLTKLGIISNYFDINYLYPCTCNAWNKSGATICKNCGGCSCDWGIANMKYGGNVCNNCDSNLEY